MQISAARATMRASGVAGTGVTGIAESPLVPVGTLLTGDTRVVSREITSAIALAATLALLAINSCSDQQGDRNILMRARTGDAPEATRKCTEEEIAEIRIQIEVVRNYWALSYEAEYDTFSSGFKQILKDAGVSSASDYARVMASNQRRWLRQTYQKAEIRDGRYGQVTVLAEWRETDYQGVQSVIFDMVKENGMWKIASIFY